MTKEQLAALLNGREYRKEITKAEAVQAKADGLLVIYGASDDLMEFDGAFRDELGAYDGCDAMVHQEGVLTSWEDFDGKEDEAEAEAYFYNKRRGVSVKADFDQDGYTWVISTALPHATFEIMEDDEKFCRGIVINVADIAQAVQPVNDESANAKKAQAVINAAQEWSSERAPSDHAEGKLMKAIATMDGDWAGCEECDHQCDEPCMPATVVEIHASIDACLAKLEAKKTEEGRKQWRAIEATTQPAKAPKPITGPCGQCKSSANTCYCMAAAV